MQLDERNLRRVFPESWKTAEASGSLENIMLALKKDISAEKVPFGIFTLNPMEEFTRIMGLESPNYIPDDIPTATLSLNTTSKSTATASFTLTSTDTHTTKITLTATTSDTGTSKCISLNVDTTTS